MLKIVSIVSLAIILSLLFIVASLFLLIITKDLWKDLWR